MNQYHTAAEHFFADLCDAADLIAGVAAELPTALAAEYIESQVADTQVMIAAFAAGASAVDQRTFMELWKTVGEALRQQVDKRRA